MEEGYEDGGHRFQPWNVRGVESHTSVISGKGGDAKFIDLLIKAEVLSSLVCWVNILVHISKSMKVDFNQLYKTIALTVQC